MHTGIIAKNRLINTKVRYNDIYESFFIWLIIVIIWNFSLPIQDVIVAIILSCLNVGLKKIIK